jgi:hypothetical protein
MPPHESQHDKAIHICLRSYPMYTTTTEVRTPSSSIPAFLTIALARGTICLAPSSTPLIPRFYPPRGSVVSASFSIIFYLPSPSLLLVLIFVLIHRYLVFIMSTPIHLLLPLEYAANCRGNCLGNHCNAGFRCWVACHALLTRGPMFRVLEECRSHVLVLRIYRGLTQLWSLRYPFLSAGCFP